MLQLLILFLLLNAAAQPIVQERLVSLFSNQVYDYKIAFLLASVLFLIYLSYLRLSNLSEGFFFEVSTPSSCSGLYRGKPISFEYSTVGSGECDENNQAPLGMIGAGDKYGGKYSF